MVCGQPPIAAGLTTKTGETKLFHKGALPDCAGQRAPLHEREFLGDCHLKINADIYLRGNFNSIV